MPNGDTEIYQAVGRLQGTVEDLCERMDNMSVQLDELRQEVAKAKGVLTLAKWLAPMIGGGSGFVAAYLKDFIHR